MKTITEWKAQLQTETKLRQIWNAHEGDVDIVYTVEHAGNKSV